MIHNDRMAKKLKKYKYPTVIVFTPPGHVNFNDNSQRNKLATSIEKLAVNYVEQRVMCLKQWDFNDQALVARMQSGYRFTARGLK